jgi:hypothetical protein
MRQGSFFAVRASCLAGLVLGGWGPRQLLAAGSCGSGGILAAWCCLLQGGWLTSTVQPVCGHMHQVRTLLLPGSNGTALNCWGVLVLSVVRSALLCV